MRKNLVSIAFIAMISAMLGGRAHALADCTCPPLTLDERIADAAYIFSGKPLMFAQIPPGASPFHSESSMESPGGVANDIVMLFAVDRVWKGEAMARIKVRRSAGVCTPDFQLDRSVIVFARADPSGILWTGICSGDAVKGDERYEALRGALTDRLTYN